MSDDGEYETTVPVDFTSKRSRRKPKGEEPDREADPPQDLAAEQSVLGAVMLAEPALLEVADELRVEHFYKPAHQTVYRCVLEMFARGTPVDAITVSGELESRGELLRIGGAPYLHTLIASVPTAANAGYYAEQVRDAASRRTLGEVGTALRQLSVQPTTEVGELLTSAQTRLAEVTERTTAPGGALLEDLLQPAVDEIDAIASGSNVGLSTGFADLDAVTNGLHPGQMITVAARPGVGKTALGLAVARAASIRHGAGTVFFSLEMGRNEIVQRLLSAEARVRLEDIRGGTMGDDDWTRMARRMPEVSAAPLALDDTASLSPLELSTRARRWKRSFGEQFGLIVVDYLQLMTPARRGESRQQEVSEISRMIKLLAKDLEVPVVALSQLNRGPEQRTDKKPTLADLRESGAIEQDSDVVVLIHRPDAVERDDPRMGEADLILAKNRSGPTTTVTVAHQLHYSRFVDMAQE